jgi:hypothetical protein
MHFVLIGGRMFISDEGSFYARGEYLNILILKTVKENCLYSNFTDSLKYKI